MMRTCMLILAAALGVATLSVLAGCGGDGATPATSGEATSTETTEKTDTTETTETTETTATTETGDAQPTTITVVVVNGQPQGGIERPSVKKGDHVVLVVRSDVADEVHVHGYDLSRDVAAGGTARIAFVATIPGRFEVELEDRSVQLAELTVTS